MSERGGLAVRIVSDEVARAFVHPGLLHSREEIEFVKSKIEAGESPWKEAWGALREHAGDWIDARHLPPAVRSVLESS